MDLMEVQGSIWRITHHTQNSQKHGSIVNSNSQERQRAGDVSMALWGEVLQNLECGKQKNNLASSTIKTVRKREREQRLLERDIIL